MIEYIPRLDNLIEAPQDFFVLVLEVLEGPVTILNDPSVPEMCISCEPKSLHDTPYKLHDVLRAFACLYESQNETSSECTQGTFALKLLHLSARSEYASTCSKLCSTDAEGFDVTNPCEILVLSPFL